MLIYFILFDNISNLYTSLKGTRIYPMIYYVERWNYKLSETVSTHSCFTKRSQYFEMNFILCNAML